MKRILAAAMLLLFLGGCAGGSSAPELLEPITAGSDLVTAEIGDLYDGSVLEASVFPEVEELSFSTDGQVGRICAVMGQAVKEGDPLVLLDTTALQERWDRLTEAVDLARSNHEFALREAQLNAELLSQQFGWGSARVQLYENEQEEASQLRQEEIARLEEELAEAEEDLHVHSVLTAPCSGTVAAVNVNAGDWVQAEQTVAVVVNDSACTLQTEFIAESTIAGANEVYATVGGVRYQVAYVPMETEEYVSKTLSGQRLQSTFTVEKATDSLIGQYALLYLMTVRREQVLSIPANALLEDDAGYYVYLDRDGEKLRQAVEVGVTTSAQAEILSGLQEGDAVYVVR